MGEEAVVQQPVSSTANALRDMALIVDIITHTPNEVRSAKWWRVVRQRVCERHNIPSLYGLKSGAKGRPVPRGNITPPMKRVLELAADGHTVKSSATAMGLKPNTVKTHRDRTMKALGAHSIAHAVAIAIRTGIIEGAPHAEVRSLDRAIERSLAAASGGGSDADDGERERVG